MHKLKSKQAQVYALINLNKKVVYATKLLVCEHTCPKLFRKSEIAYSKGLRVARLVGVKDVGWL